MKIKLLPEKHWLLLLMVNPDNGCGLTSKVLVLLSLQPKPVVDTSFTEKLPVVVYECEGESVVEVVASPKFHRYVVAPVVLFVNTKLFPLKH